MNDLDKGMTMRNNKMTLRKTDVCKRKKTIAMFLAVFIVLALTLAASSDVSAAGKVKAYGMLTSIEDDGTVIIDKIGYLVSPSVTIRNYRDESILLRDISLPHNVYFEYEYRSEGFMIILIEEVAG
ncbi:MAG: hypothetical protein HGB21_02750 [Nitrospirae bacterium]|nr:hypothetical protein [Nitrospirota bacterium]NTW65223.1 hypothetical protein [Nitrospirota bacterium]